METFYYDFFALFVQLLCRAHKEGFYAHFS